MNQNVRKLVLTSVLTALAIVLSILFSFIPGLNLKMPMGGSFFGIHMIPLVLIGFMVGLKYALLGSLIFAVFNFGMDYFVYLDALKATLESWSGITWGFKEFVALFLFDYIIPFGAFGLSGLFHHSLKDNKKSIYAFVTVSAIRFVSSTLSGVLIWHNSILWAAEEAATNPDKVNIATRIFAFVGENTLLYSALYNLTYNLSTLIVSLIIYLAIRPRLDLASEQLNLNSVDQ